MPYNVELEKRIDRLIETPETYDKKKMFGGIGYLKNGNMFFGIHKQSLIIRTTPAIAGELLKKESMRPFDITGRPMQGWVMVANEGIKTDKELLTLLNLAIEYGKTLPPK